MKEMNWADAQIYCRETGGFLAEILSKEEEILLDTFLIGGKSYWLGLTDKGNEGIYNSNNFLSVTKATLELKLSNCLLFVCNCIPIKPHQFKHDIIEHY